MLSPFEFAALSHERYEERLREAKRDQDFDRAVSQFVRSTLMAAGRHIAALLDTLMRRDRQGRLDGVELRSEPSAR